MRSTFRLVLAVACALAAAPATHAATPFTAGTGFGQDLAVGSDGTGHVVFLSDEEPADRVNYCRVPAGGSACDAESLVLDFPGPQTDAFSIGDEAQVFTPAPNKVVILASCFACGPPGSPDRVYRWISVNNGVSFGAPGHVGDIALVGQAGYLDTGDIALGVEGGLFQAMDAPPASSVQLVLGGGFPFVYSSAVVPGPVAGQAVHVVNDLHAIRYAVFHDPSPATVSAADFNVLGNWDTEKPLTSPEPDNSETHLSSGSGGLFLSYRSFLSEDERVGVRRYDNDSESFGAPVYAEGSNRIDDNSLDYPHHSQDAAGRLHVVWRTLYDGGRLRYSRSDDGGASFSAAGTLASNETFLDPTVEAAPDGTGFVTWKAVGTSPVRVVAIDPVAETIPDPDAPGIDDFGIGDSSLTPGQGTSFTFDSSEAGNAVLTFQKRIKGKKVKRKGKRLCKQVSARKFKQLKKKKRCRAWKKIGEIRQVVTPGLNTITFNGRIAGRRLSKGRYRARLVITDAAGNVSRTETITFRVVAKKKKKKKK